MPNKKPDELLNMAVDATEPYHTPMPKPMYLVIRKGKLQMIPKLKFPSTDILITFYTKKMLSSGLSDDEWIALKNKLVKYQKEITN